MRQTDSKVLIDPREEVKWPQTEVEAHHCLLLTQEGLNHSSENQSDIFIHQGERHKLATGLI